MNERISQMFCCIWLILFARVEEVYLLIQLMEIPMRYFWGWHLENIPVLDRRTHGIPLACW